MGTNECDEEYAKGYADGCEEYKERAESAEEEVERLRKALGLVKKAEENKEAHRSSTLCSLDIAKQALEEE